METKSSGVEAVDELKERSRRGAESHFWVVEKFFIIVLVATSSLHVIDDANKAGQKAWAIIMFSLLGLLLVVYGTWCWSAVAASQMPESLFLDAAEKREMPRRLSYRLQQGFLFILAFLMTLVIAGYSFQGDSQLEAIMKMQKENSAKLDRLMERVGRE